MREPSLSEKETRVFICISEILNMTDMEDLHVEKYASLGSQKAASLQPSRAWMSCMHASSHSKIHEHTEILIINCYVACISLSAKRILNDMDTSS